MFARAHIIYLVMSLFLIGSQVAPYSFTWMDIGTLLNLIVEENEVEEKEKESFEELKKKYRQDTITYKGIDPSNGLDFPLISTAIPPAPYMEKSSPPPDSIVS
ncbi:MAG: hypothetical protein HKN79_02975 [Flavobacteriales bacterium]|nr:hypothetical protein [Flavobacteriales bacterium]